jgi:hypothetical protein
VRRSDCSEDDRKQKVHHFRELVFGLMVCSVVMFLFLPFFGAIHIWFMSSASHGTYRDGKLYSCSFIYCSVELDCVRDSNVGVAKLLFLLWDKSKRKI